MARYQKCDIKVESLCGVGGGVGWIFATYRCSMSRWSASTTQSTGKGYEGCLAHLLAAQALNGYSNNASAGGLCTCTYTNKRNLLVVMRL